MKQFFAHPGTWVFLVLLLIAIGVIIAYAAPVLLAAAALPLIVLAGAAAFAAVLTALKYLNENFIDFFAAFTILPTWASNNKGKAALAVLAVALLITAAVLTVGFFAAGGVLVVGVGGTVVAAGGGAFAFMAPVFAAIAAPFAGLSAAAVGAVTFTPAGLAAVVGVTFLTAPLWLANTLDRIRAFFSKGVDQLPPRIVADDVEDHLPSEDHAPKPSVRYPSNNPTIFEFFAKKISEKMNSSSAFSPGIPLGEEFPDNDNSNSENSL